MTTLRFKTDDEKDLAEEIFNKVHRVYSVFGKQDRRADLWEEVQAEFTDHGSVAVTSLSKDWGVISADHLSQDEKKELLAILDAKTDED
jgi:hypothetical protein